MHGAPSQKAVLMSISNPTTTDLELSLDPVVARV
jgi:hypothetical protein